MKLIIRIGLLIVIAGLAVLFFVVNPAENPFFPRCAFHSLTGYYCPGCGSQRALHSLLHLDITEVAGNNFLFIPALLIVFYHYLRPFSHRLFHWKLPNIFYFKSTPWIILGIIVLFWILRNLPYYPFSLLAPNG